MTGEIERQEPRRRRTWKGILGIGLAVFLVLMIASYFVVTSSSFMKSVILPRVAKSMNSDLKVESFSLSPFSEVYLTGLKLQPNGRDTLLTASEAHLRYSLIDIIQGTIRVDELTLVSPVIDLVKNPDGSSNLDPITQGNSKEKQTPSEPKKYQLAIKNISLKNATVRRVDKLKDGGSKTTELANLNVTLDQLITGTPGKLTFASDFSTLNAPKNGTNDLIRGNLKGAFEIALDAALKPQGLNGSTTLKLGRTTGTFAEFSGVGVTLDADVTPKEIRQMAIHFSKDDQALGELRISGLFDMNTMEGRLTQVLSIDKRVLNLAGAPRGFGFGDSIIHSTNMIDLSKKGTLIGVAGKLEGRAISLTKLTQQTPVLNLDADYRIVVDRAEESALIQKLNLSATQNGKDLLQTALSRQMNLSWGSSVPGFTDSAFRMVLTNLDLSQWAGVIGTNSPAGVVSASVDLLAQQDGRMLSTTIAAQVNNLSVNLGTNALQGAQVQLKAFGTVENLRVVNLNKYTLSVQQQDKGTLVQADGSLRYDLKNKDVRGQATLGANLATVVQQFPAPQFSITAGEAKVSASFSVDDGKTTAIGSFSFQDLTGRYAEYLLDKLQITLEYNVEMSNNLLQIHTAGLSFAQGVSKGGSVDLKGSYDLTKKTAALDFKTVDLNQNALAPFLRPLFGENKLVSISLNSGGTIGYDPNGDASIKADLSIDKWMVQDAAKKISAEPLSVKLQIDAGMNKQIVDLRQILLKLIPTKRAKNELSVKGRIDLAKTNATPGTLAIQSDSFDLTPYYDLFAGEKTSAAASTDKKISRKPAIAASAVPAKDENKEPGPMALPFQDFTATVNIGELYLRQIAVSNLITTAKITNGEVRLNPLQLSLNGAPVSANILLNLGVPGYTCDLSFNADRVPLEPIVNSLSTNSAGQLKGLLVAKANIKGAGTTGLNLQKNLSGSADFSVTNMNVQVVSPKWRNVLEPIALVLNLPELTETPLDWMAGRTEMGAGKINLQQFTVVSAAFMATSQGTIPIEPILTNSPLNLPLSLSISRGLAQKAHVPINETGGNTNYVKLPDFVTIDGTIGKPGTRVNKIAIAGMIAQSTGLTDKALKALPPSAGNLLQNVLGGGKVSTNANSTNAVAGTNSASANLLRDLSGILNARKTNQPAANTNGVPAVTKPARPNPLDLLKGFGK